MTKEEEYEIDTEDENSTFKGMSKKDAKKLADKLGYALSIFIGVPKVVC